MAVLVETQVYETSAGPGSGSGISGAAGVQLSSARKGAAAASHGSFQRWRSFCSART